MKTIIKHLVIAGLFLGYIISSYAQDKNKECDTIILTEENDSPKVTFNGHDLTNSGEITWVHSNYKIQIDSVLLEKYKIYRKPKEGKCTEVEGLNQCISTGNFHNNDVLYIAETSASSDDKNCPTNAILEFTVITASRPDSKTTSEAKVNYEITNYFSQNHDSFHFFPIPSESRKSAKSVIVHNLYNITTTGNINDSISPKRKRFRVGDTVQHIFLNFEDQYESIEVSQSFNNFNTENSTTFADLIGIDKKDDTTPKPEPENDKGGGKPIAKGARDSIIEGLKINFYKIISNQSTTYVTHLKNYPTYSYNVSADYDVFKQQIINSIDGIENASIKEITAVLTQFETPAAIRDQIIKNLTYIENYRTAVTPEVQIEDADEYVLTMSYKKSTGEITPITYTYPILGGFKIDFSTGFVFSYLISDKYQIIDTDPIERTVTENGEGTTEMIDQKEIITGKKDNLNLGVAVMAHAYTRMTPYFSPAISFGVTVEHDTSVNWPVGVSLLLGRKSRIVLTGGVIFGKADRLLSKYEVGKSYDATMLNGLNDAQLVTSVSRTKPFFALTYNFAGLRSH